MSLLQLPLGAAQPKTVMGTARLAVPGITPASAYSPSLSPTSPLPRSPVAVSPSPRSPAAVAAFSAGTVIRQMPSNAPVHGQSSPPLQSQGPWVVPSAAVDPHARELWGRIDAEGKGAVSSAEFRAAVARDAEVAAHAARCGADRAFEAMAEGKEQADFADFEAQHRLAAAIDRMPPSDAPRSSKRVFIISSGFGRLLRPAQTQLVERAGFKIHWCTKPPNPETPNFAFGPHLQQIKSELDEFKPDLVMCASKGGVYVVKLWDAGLWLGPTLMINAHPSCQRLPRGVPLVIAAGGDDEHYPSTRKILSQLMSTGTRSHCFLYYAAGSGTRLPPGFALRLGDRHNMDSLLSNDCLPRLMDAALCPQGAEVHMARTHVGLVSDSRLEAERPLREQLLQRLAACSGWLQRLTGLDSGVPLSPVEPGSDEFGWVAAAFRSPPKAPSAYRLPSQVPFESVRIAALHRVQHGPDAGAAALSRFAELRSSLERQGVPFEAEAHERWAFYHGCGAQGLSGGLQPLAAGPWGAGIYFARDAKYVVDAGSCRGADGSRTVLMCLLASGMPCVGDAARGGELPRRRGAACYDCAVDSLSSPELYVVPRASSAVPAYLITLA